VDFDGASKTFTYKGAGNPIGVCKSAFGMLGQEVIARS
jgi:hypothetical protein